MAKTIPDSAASSTNIVNSSGVTIAPNSYSISECTIHPNNNDPIDIRDLIVKINISESLYLSSLITVITIRDGVNMLGNLRINGNEKITLKIFQEPIDQDKKEIDLEMYISDIFNFSKPTFSSQMYELRCVSEHAYLNQLKVLDKPFDNSINKLIENIIESDLQIPTKRVNKDNANASTFGIVKGVYPQLKPINAINWLIRNAFDNSTPFFFYETVKKGITLKSFNEMSKEAVLREYNHMKPNFEHTFDESKATYDEQLLTIRKISGDLEVSKFNDASNGAYGSEMTTVDIATKSFNTKKHKYEGLPAASLNKYKPFAETSKFQDRKMNEYTTAKQYFVSENSKAFDKPNYHHNTKDNLQKSSSLRSNLDFMTQNLTLNGDFELYSGAVVKLNILKPEHPDVIQDTKEVDELMSGKYVVSSISHVFDADEYYMLATVKKESSALDLDGAVKL